MTEKPEPIDIEQALLDPAAVFADPEGVLAHGDLTTSQKVEILRRWEYDARELQVAQEENMGDDRDNDLLDRVLQALHHLGAAVDVEHSPPTKQGGA